MKMYFRLLSVLLVCIISSMVNAQDKKKSQQLDSLYINLFSSGLFNGNVLIAEKGKVIYEKSFGIANEKTKQQLNSKTIFELASVSKQFTAMAIVLLEKQGKLSYNDDVIKYIPELSDYKGITIRNLLIHTAGLPDYMELAGEKWDKSKIATNNDILQLFKAQKPAKVFEPNAKWEYSNTGYLILASVIERVSGKSYGDFLKQTIFSPLEMKNTFVYRRRYEPKKIDNYAEGYIYSDSLKRKILPDEIGKDFYVVVLDGIVGDGMVNSTTEDLLKWDRALYSNKLINDKDRQLIFSSYKTTNEKDTDYGFGWKIENTQTFGKIASHSGGWAGYVTYIERHMDNDKTIIILQNNALEKTKIPAKMTRQILYNLPIEKAIVLNETISKKYAGKYLFNGKEKIIIFENGKLYIPMNEEIKLELIPVSETKFIVDGFSPEVTYTFLLDEKGEVLQYRNQQMETGIDVKGIRIK